MKRTPLKRRKPLRSGIARNPNRVRSEAHLQWVRGHHCAVPFCTCREIVAAHVREGLPAEASKGGTSLKPGDDWVIPLCVEHHLEQHALGEQPFDDRYGIDRIARAEELQAKSPVLQRRRWQAETAERQARRVA